jgi:signal transduction histidine kinase
MLNFTTSFAPAERIEQRIIEKQANYFFNDESFSQLLDLIPVIIMVLNPQRQLVFGNQALLDFLSLSDVEQILGKRPGEMLNCKHANENLAGCGTTKFCRYCGAVKAILESQKHGGAMSECRILSNINGNDEAYDFRVWANQIKQNNTLFAVINIDDEKRRLFLERIFLHDIANTCSALSGFSNLLYYGDISAEEKQSFIARIKFLSRQINNEITGHQQLIAAEYNQLTVNVEPINSLKFIKNLHEVFDDKELLNGRFLLLDKEAQNVIFSSDKTLLTRVVSNMVKNALEGSARGETVTLGCYKKESQLCIWVHNPTYIPENIRMQIFNRSFSTKGLGRGLGTYSMKYFTEKYLRGSIAFTSEEGKGSVFTACYPIAAQ